MGYFRVGEDWDGLAGLDGPGLGAVAAPSSVLTRSRYLMAAYDRRGAARMPRIVLPRSIAARPIVMRSAIRSSALRGFGAADDPTALLRQISDTLSEMRGLGDNVPPLIGAGTIVSQAGTLMGDLGVPINQQDIIQTAVREARRMTGLSGDFASDVSTFLGTRMARSLQGSNIPVGDIASMASGLAGVYGNIVSGGDAATSAVWNMIRDLGGLSSGNSGFSGLRRMIEVFQGDITLPSWLNRETMGRAVKAAEAWVSVASDPTARNVLLGIGSTMMLGAAVPIVGWACAVVGALIDIAAALLAVFEEPPPPPPTPCSPVAPRYADAWAALRVWIAANESSTYGDSLGVSDLQGAGWNVRVDPSTGEVLAKEPGSTVYRRLLDLFPAGRVSLLSLENDWIAGNSAEALRAMGAQDCRGNSAYGRTYGWMETKWAQNCLYEWRPYSSYGQAGRRAINDSTPRLYCTPDNEELLTAFINADRTSPGVRYRVPTKASATSENGSYRGISGIVDGPTAVGYDRIMKEASFQPIRKAGILAAAVLGGCAPFGIVGLRGTVGVCTGVGGRVDAEGTWCPAIAVWDRDHVAVIPPQRMPSQLGSSSRAWATSLDPKTLAIPLAAVIEELADHDARINKWRAPDSSPDLSGIPEPPPSASSLLPGTARFISAATLMRPMKVFKSDADKEGMGRGTKIALGIAGGAVVVGGGYLALRHLRRRG